MDRLNRRLADLDETLGKPETYNDPEALARLTRERGEKASEREALELEWLELAGELEAATNSVD